MSCSAELLYRPGGSCLGHGEHLRDGAIPDEALAKLVRKVFPLSPAGMIEHLKLRTPIYTKTAAYGHFGRPEFAWERVDAGDELRAKMKNV